MQINPWLAIALNALYAILTGLSIPVVDSLGGSGYSDKIVAWAAIAAVPLNMVLHAFSSSTPGPAAPQDSPAVTAATAVASLPSSASQSQIDTTKSAAKRAIDAQKGEM